MDTPQSAGRFADRVADYVRYRPGYPPQVLELLTEHGVLRSGTVIADIGSGTGFAAELFLSRGHTVFGIEPNDEMRAAGAARLAGFQQFHSLIGTAEATSLPPQSVDLIVAAQAFHWFDRVKARDEFQRILRNPGNVAVLWNTRSIDTSPFLWAYESLLQTFGTDYREVVHTNVTEQQLDEFFGNQLHRRFTIPNSQALGAEGLRGRTRSCSYVPGPSHPNHAMLMTELDCLFAKFEKNGTVSIEYETELIVGDIGQGPNSVNDCC